MFKYLIPKCYLTLNTSPLIKLKPAKYFVDIPSRFFISKKFSTLNSLNNKYPDNATDKTTIINNQANELNKDSSTCLSKENSDKFNMKISFHSKMQISKHGYVIRFRLPEETSSSKFSICRYIYLEGIADRTGELVKRPYHPISLDTDKGFIDVFIKVYEKNPREKFGIFSNFLVNLQEGQVLTLHGSYGSMVYEGNGNFSIFKQTQNSILNKKVKRIGMIAGGSGIAPMFQLIQKIITTRDNTAVSLIYCTKSIDEMSFGEDLIKFDRKGKLSFYPVVENVESANWAFGKGKVDQEMIFNYMPDPAGK